MAFSLEASKVVPLAALHPMQLYCLHCSEFDIAQKNIIMNTLDIISSLVNHIPTLQYQYCCTDNPVLILVQKFPVLIFWKVYSITNDFILTAYT